MLKNTKPNAVFRDVYDIQNSTLTFYINGEIDHHNARALREGMDTIISQTRAKNVKIDLSCVDFMDSSGLGLILGRYTKVRECAGTLYVVGASERSAKILHMAGVDKIIKIN